MPNAKNDEKAARLRARDDTATEPFDGEEYVRWAYRLLLGREPESPEISEKNPFKNDRQRLVQFVLNSGEFKRSNSLIFGEQDPLHGGRNQIATKEDIFYCFRLLLGRNPNPQEWPGHSSRVGQDLGRVVGAYVTSHEFAVRGMLNKTYTDAVELVQFGTFSLFASRDDLGVSLAAIQAGTYEPHVGSVFKRYIRTGMSVLDVGANIGYFTMLSAALVGPNGLVVAIEPNPENVKLIEASRCANGFDHVTIVPAAAGRKTGILALNVSHLNGVTTEMRSDIGQILGSRPVPCFALDAVLPKDTRLDFIKIDVEGAELNAMVGLCATLDRCRPIIVSEFSPGWLPGISGCTGPEYLRFLIDKGYSISVIEKDGSETSFGDEADGVMEAYKRVGVDHIDILALPRAAK